MIIVPKFVALDTSTLNCLARDLFEGDSKACATAHNFLSAIFSRGWLPVVTFEILLEMTQHGNDETVARRFHLFEHFKELAYVESCRNPGTLGSVLDILAREVMTVLVFGAHDPSRVADAARTDMFTVTTGKAFQQHFGDCLEVMRDGARLIHTETKALSSLSHIDILGVGDVPLSSLRFTGSVSPGTMAAHIVDVRNDVTRQLEAKGVADMDFGTFVDEFVAQVARSLRQGSGKDSSGPVAVFVQSLLNHFHIDPVLLRPDMTIRELSDLGAFNHKLEVVSDVLGLSHAVTAVNIPPESCPSHLVDRGLCRIRRSAPRACAGDIIDAHLAAMTCYCDLTVVDKRTKEYIRQLLKGQTAPKPPVRRVEKLSRYADLLEIDL